MSRENLRPMVNVNPRKREMLAISYFDGGTTDTSRVERREKLLSILQFRWVAVSGGASIQEGIWDSKEVQVAEEAGPCVLIRSQACHYL